MVFYRTYRPQKISELDSESVRQALSAIAASKEVPHAFLLTGSRGLGKTSAARIIAKIVNCEKRKGIEPCNRCAQCVSITQGTNLDVLEIDAASNRGIDEVRTLRENIKLAPSGSTKKVYIIDEVHMLTTEAFNALLKILEEPPEHAMFILATTDAYRVPATIVSRCYPLSFTRASQAELLRSLKRIVDREKIGIDKEALGAIAGASDGSFRDASKILELAAIRKGRRKITEETIHDVIGSIGNVFGCISHLKEKNAQKALLWLSESVDNGLNIKAWLEEILAGLHNALLYQYDVKNSEVTSELRDFSQEELKKLLILFSQAHQELRYAVIPQLPVELAIIEYCIEKDS